MKNKPIKNGFKFWPLSCPASGFVYRFVPGGRLKNNKIYDVVNNMADALLEMDKREDTMDTNYVLVMDNSIISHLQGQLERGAIKGRVLVLLGLQEQNQVGLVSSLKFFYNCFNSLYDCDDEEGFCIFAWLITTF